TPYAPATMSAISAGIPVGKPSSPAKITSAAISTPWREVRSRMEASVAALLSGKRRDGERPHRAPLARPSISLPPCPGDCPPLPSPVCYTSGLATAVGALGADGPTIVPRQEGDVVSTVVAIAYRDRDTAVRVMETLAQLQK